MTPQLVPSVNEIHAAFSPCLTADLKTIIFAGWISRKTEYDLYIATREAVDQPFSTPRILAECVTSWTDAFPTLSSNGLELVFTSSDDASPSVMPRLLRCKRTLAGQTFSAPEPLSIPGVEVQEVRFSCPQFLDDFRLKLGFVGPKEQRSIMLTRRSEPRAEFAKPEVLPFDDVFTLWYLAGNGARAYAGNRDGIHLTHRASATERFGKAELLIPASSTGPIEGPIWVAPQEDVIFYCSPGPGKFPGAGRLLWMVAF